MWWLPIELVLKLNAGLWWVVDAVQFRSLMVHTLVRFHTEKTELNTVKVETNPKGTKTERSEWACLH